MGWIRGKTGLVTMQYPSRKHKSLCVKDGNVIKPLCTFRDDESAELFDRVLDYLIEGKEREK